MITLMTRPAQHRRFTIDDLVYATFGVSELWAIDTARPTVHLHCDVGPDGYADVRLQDL